MPVKAELRRDADQVAISPEKDGAALIAITSKSGIGGVKLTRVGDAWPKALALKINVSVASTTSFHFPVRVSGEWASGRLPMGRIAYDQRWSEPSLVSLM